MLSKIFGRKPKGDKQPERMLEGSVNEPVSDWSAKIDQHYQAVWHQAGEACKFDPPAWRADDLPTDFKVLLYKPTPDRAEWTYATAGMSQPTDQSRLELHILAAEPSPELVELLYITAHYHRTGAPLDLGHTVNFGRPWVQNSDCSYGLISLPYFDGPALENGSICGKPVSFYWLIPISKSERDFKRDHGLEALEQKFEEINLNAADPHRHPVI